MLRYDAAYLAVALLSSPVLAARMLRTGKWRTDWRGRFGHVELRGEAGEPRVLIHGVSVGEVAATRTLVDALTAASPVPELAVSSTTNTGILRARALFGERHAVVRFPFDLSWMVRRFLDATEPSVVVLVELEVWPNLVLECARRGIPVCVVNGRLSESSHRGYRRIGPWVRRAFAALSAVGAQTEEYARRFVELGTPEDRVAVTDTMKWDNVEIVDHDPDAETLAATLGVDRTRPVVVAGSTGPGEEEMLIASRPEGVQLVLVPRKPERFEEVASLAPGMVRRSNPPGRTTGADLFLLDSMGELDRAYHLADVAVVGRSFVPMGGSDPIPPVAAGRPTLIGPHHENFAQVVSAFVEGGGIRVTDRPMAAASELLADPDAGRAMAERGRSVIEGRQGASLRSADIVSRLLRERAAAR